METSKKYERAPQMRDYDRLWVTWVPYLMFLQARNYSSAAVNTDEFGLRHSPRLAAEPSGTVRLLFGGSTAFGVGASADDRTISAYLERKSNVRWLNYGGRAYNSTQELMLYQFFAYGLDNVDRIVLFSGLNDSFLPHMAVSDIPEIPVMFNNSLYIEAMKAVKPLNWRKKLAKLVVSHWVEADYSEIAMGELLRRAFSSRPGAPAETPVDLVKTTARAISHLRRNLTLWKALADSRSVPLHYVLQPVFSWCGKQKSKEEEEIFAELDRSPGILGKLQVVDSMYEDFSDGAAAICRDLCINYVDINILLKQSDRMSEWLFVDRVHLTDAGNDLVSDILISQGVA